MEAQRASIEKLLKDHNVKSVLEFGHMPALVGSDVSVTPFESWEGVADKKFDLIFIGLTNYDNALVALHNCRMLGSLVILDGTVSQWANMTDMNDGAVRAWGDTRHDGIVTELLSEDYGVGHGMSVGQYKNII
jgi:hypothetical protein